MHDDDAAVVGADDDVSVPKANSTTASLPACPVEPLPALSARLCSPALNDVPCKTAAPPVVQHQQAHVLGMVGRDGKVRFRFAGTLDRQHACFCLADGGADDSFISEAFVFTHKLRLHNYPVALRYEVANNQSVFCTQYVKVHLSIQQFSCFCTLTVMPELVHEYDILLGADWLTVQGALLDYVDKSLTLRTPKGQPTLLPSAVSKKGSVNCTVESLQTVKPVKEAYAIPPGFLVPGPEVVYTPLSAKTAAKWLKDGGTGVVALVSYENLQDPPGVPPEQAAQLKSLLMEFSDVFEPITGLPPARDVGHSIPLQDGAKPPARPSYRMSQPEQEEVKKQVTDMLSKGLIEPSSSPFAAPVLFVKKKSGELRMCVDYRQLNKLTIRDQYPLPRIDDLFDKLSGMTVFSSLDLQAGYHQIRIPDEDIPKTAFRTPMGHYQYKVLCFGLTNAPATFQRAMNQAFATVIDRCALVYLDDILIMSKSIQEHLSHLREIFSLLRQHKYFAKLSKCEFMKESLPFLGHIISKDGVAVDPSKVAAIKDWPVPTNLTALQSFLGMANYVRKFVHNFSAIAAPLTNLTGPEGKSFNWEEWPKPQLDAFNAVKQAVMRVPMLRLPDTTKPFQVYCDASLLGVGAVLMQDGYPLAYYSRKLTKAEKNYTTGEQETLAIIAACTQWRCYLEGVQFTLYTDHRPLEALPTQSTLSRRQSRWLEFLSRFDYTIKYLPGNTNPADPLSRIPVTSATAKTDTDKILVTTRQQKRRLQEGEEAGVGTPLGSGSGGSEQQPAAGSDPDHDADSDDALKPLEPKRLRWADPVSNDCEAQVPECPGHPSQVTDWLISAYSTDPAFAEPNEEWEMTQEGLWRHLDK
ncbi:MAG: reverse transcriptase domain-containing protein, partial [Agrobacterium sp.]|uniref:reverse transcriptase domain-containing protein n=1 Tax=Agrobacterium sp. TaxID=361 RepID=UPI0040382645